MSARNLFLSWLWLQPLAAAADGPALLGEGDDQTLSQRQAVVPSSTHLRLRLQATGQQLRIQQRGILQAGPWNLSVLNERDPGEGRWNDHVVGFAQRTGQHLDLVIGHLRPAFGQGLLFGRGRSTSVPSPMPRHDGSNLGYRSAAEGHTIRGAAIRKRSSWWTAAWLVGGLRWDARIADDGVAVSLPEDGDHSGTGTTKRDRLRGAVFAGRWRLHTHGADLGLSVQRLSFARVVDLRREETPYAFHGRGQWATAVDLGLRRGRIRWYGAIARAGTRLGMLAGASAITVVGMRLDVLGRWYGPGFFAPLGAAASGGAMDNERGLTAQVRRRGFRLWMDVTARPAPRWRKPLPSWKRGGGVHVQRHSGPWEWSGDLQRRVGSLWLANIPGVESTYRARLQGRWSPGEVRLTMRTDGVHYRRIMATPAGYVQRGVAGSVALRWRQHRVQLEGLATLFITDGYGARVYEYEPELPEAISIRPIYGRGTRLVAVMRVSLRSFVISARWRVQVWATGMRHTAGLQIDRRSRIR